MKQCIGPCLPAKWRRLEGLTFVRRCQRCRRVLVTAKADTAKLAAEFEAAGMPLDDSTEMRRR